MNREDKFGRKLHQVNVNFRSYMCPEYKVGDLVKGVEDPESPLAIVTAVTCAGEVTLDCVTNSPMNEWRADNEWQDYEIELMSPID